MRILNLLLIAALVLLQGQLWFSRDGLWELWRLDREVEERTLENGRLEARNAALEADVFDLKNGLAAVEERARMELGMVGRGETFYQIVPRADAAEP